jgi:hypothetical protein
VQADAYAQIDDGAAAILVLSASGAGAQGIPVIDQTAILKHIESITQLKSQLDALNQQITQAEQLFGSLNKLTEHGRCCFPPEPAGNPQGAYRKTLRRSKACSAATARVRSSDAASKFLGEQLDLPAPRPTISTPRNWRAFRTAMPAR